MSLNPLFIYLFIYLHAYSTALINYEIKSNAYKITQIHTGKQKPDKNEAQDKKQPK